MALNQSAGIAQTAMSNEEGIRFYKLNCCHIWAFRPSTAGADRLRAKNQLTWRAACDTLRLAQQEGGKQGQIGQRNNKPYSLIMLRWVGRHQSRQFKSHSERNKIKILLRLNCVYDIMVPSSRVWGDFMQQYHDCPQVLREFLIYHENIKGQSKLTISEYYLDLRMFLRFIKLMRCDMPINTNLDEIDIRSIDLKFISEIETSDIFDFLSYLANDRIICPESVAPEYGISASSRARKLSAIKSFFKYLTVRTKQLDENPVADLEYPKIRKSLPKYLTLEQSSSLLQAVSGQNQKRDYAILMLFLNCGIRRSELVNLNISDVYEDRIRVVGKGNKERFVYFGSAYRKAINSYLEERSKVELSDNRALFGSRDRNRISVTAVHRLVKKALLQAGLDATQFSAHKLRHTAATMMLSGGVDVKTVQEVLGHENLNTTQIYTHIENTELKIAAEANPLSKLDFSE